MGQSAVAPLNGRNSSWVHPRAAARRSSSARTPVSAGSATSWLIHLFAGSGLGPDGARADGGTSGVSTFDPTWLYVAKEIRTLMEEAGLDPALLQVRTDHPDGVRALTVTSPEDSGGLAILPRCDY